ncbi:MAG: flagellar filament capping protein FliD [Myxococcales bacterium]|nr:flagellar filament capping protein FliD [Myxococcales bacterium]
MNRPVGAPSGSYAVNVSVAAEKATLTASGALVGGLAQNETLSFTFSRDHTTSAPTISGFSVDLGAGDSLAQVINKLNSAFATQGAGLNAIDEGGRLKIESNDYGADFFFSVVSDVGTGIGGTEFGTTTLEDAGVDIAGTINGIIAVGSGSSLRLGDGALSGLTVDYKGSLTGLLGTIDLSTGLSDLFSEAADRISGDDSAFLNGRNESLQQQIDRLNDQIAKKEESIARTQGRLEREFANLEVTLAQLQSQQTFVTNQLQQLQSLR